MLSTPSTIAIDGPTASGKSTVGALLAERLGYVYFDTGIVYRAVTWVAICRGVPIADEAAVTRLAETVVVDVLRPTVADGRQNTVLADGMDVTWETRRPEVEREVSPTSAYRGVREALTAAQRRLAVGGRIVMVGRDIGTVVLPDADIKFFLVATALERARRRQRERVARGENVSVEEVLSAMERRDQLDSTRQIAPLRPADDAHIVDTEHLTLDQVLEKILEIVRACDP